MVWRLSHITIDELPVARVLDEVAYLRHEPAHNTADMRRQEQRLTAPRRIGSDQWRTGANFNRSSLLKSVKPSWPRKNNSACSAFCRHRLERGLGMPQPVAEINRAPAVIPRQYIAVHLDADPALIAPRHVVGRVALELPRLFVNAVRSPSSSGWSWNSSVAELSRVAGTWRGDHGRVSSCGKRLGYRHRDAQKCTELPSQQRNRTLAVSEARVAPGAMTRHPQRPGATIGMRSH
jgi:hypothetical protein